MRNRIPILVASFVAVVLMGSPAWAQGPSGAAPVFTYVAEWGVPRALWGEVEKVNAETKPLLDSLVADGTLLGHGVFEVWVHSDGGYTHGSWFQASSVGSILKALEKIYARPAVVTSPMQAASTHQDYLMISTVHAAKPVSNSAGYLRVISGEFAPGQEEAFRAAYDRYIKPVYDKLLADGTLVSYQFDTEFSVQNAPGRYFSVALVPNAEALDRVAMTFNQVFAANPAALAALVSTSVPNSRHDLLARVTSMTHK